MEEEIPEDGLSKLSFSKFRKLNPFQKRKEKQGRGRGSSKASFSY